MENPPLPLHRTFENTKMETCALNSDSSFLSLILLPLLKGEEEWRQFALCNAHFEVWILSS
jgi:hypothetical protein